MADFQPSKYHNIYKRKAFLIEYTPDSLKLMRQGHKLTRMKLAVLSGVSASYIEDLERGQRKKPSLEMLAKLGQVLHVIFFV